MRFKIVLLLLCFCKSLVAQQFNSETIKILIENFAENLPEDFDLYELENRLVQFNKHPINLNRTNLEELKSLILLSPIQINNLLKHIEANGLLLDLMELQSITGFDQQTIENILPFVTLRTADLVDKITFQNILNFSENDLVFRIGRSLEKQKGFEDLPGSKYLGSAEKFLLRYKFNFSNRIGAALIIDKDAGEISFGGEKQLISDFQSAHLAFHNIGIFRKIILGDYSLQFGQGLSLWSGFSFGKAPDVANIVKKDIGLKPYSSANEFSFFRGIASNMGINNYIDLTAFISTRKLDASLSTENGVEVLSTINETGLHRTKTEIYNKNQLSQLVTGTVLQYHHDGFQLGILGHFTKFNHIFITNIQPYRHFNFTDNQVINNGIFYSYSYKNAFLFGEVGKSFPGGTAHINGLLASLSGKLSAVLIYRNYNKTYHNFFSQPMSESGHSSNETGVYMGMNFTPNRTWNFSLYIDRFSFAWLKFGVDAPSQGFEILTQATYTPSKTFKANIRFKSELKQENTDTKAKINYLDDVKKNNYRVDLNWQLNKTFRFQNRFEINQFYKGDSNTELGFMLYQDFIYSPQRSKISGNMRLSYFKTQSYNNRIYAYEDDVLYNFSFSMYNGMGYRAYLNIKYKVLKKFDIWTRYAIFYYPGQHEIGSGLDEIKGPKKSDVKLQLRYQF